MRRWVVLALSPWMLLACKREGSEARTTTTGAGYEIVDPKAQHQSNAPDDLGLASDVRRRLVADDTLSARAKNIVVVVQDGVATLRGPVADRVEHDLVVQKIASVPGIVRLDDRLTFEKE